MSEIEWAYQLKGRDIHPSTEQMAKRIVTLRHEFGPKKGRLVYPDAKIKVRRVTEWANYDHRPASQVR